MSDTAHPEDMPITAKGGIDTRYASVQRERYTATLADRVKRLRDLAERIENVGRPSVGHMDADGVEDINYAAQRVLSEVMWGLANLDLPGLVTVANDAHNAVRGRVK